MRVKLAVLLLFCASSLFTVFSLIAFTVAGTALIFVNLILAIVFELAAQVKIKASAFI